METKEKVTGKMEGGKKGEERERGKGPAVFPQPRKTGNATGKDTLKLKGK